MPTSDPGVVTPAGGGEDGLRERVFAQEIARVAAAIFAQLPSSPTALSPGAAVSAPGIATPVVVPVSTAEPFRVAAPFNPGPSALGTGGVSGAQTAPPTPGWLQQPPLASAPVPRDSDLRAVPTLVAASVGLPSPVLAAASAPAPDVAATPVPGMGAPLPTQTPYFLELAGPSRSMPTAGADPGPGWIPEGLSLGLVPELRSSTRLFDPASIRRDFPILNERVHGRPLVWLDNAATTQKPRAVIDRLSYYYEHENSNVHRAAHALAARATDAYEASRDKVRRFLGASSSRDIVFVRGATEAINLVAQSWGRRNVRAGDEVLITWLEHHANIVPWQQLCAETGARLCVAPVDDRGQVILEEYEKRLNPRTRIVSISQVSNALGTIVPVREMVEMAHRHGARALVDGAQAVSHMPVDVQAIGCDFYCFSGHKVFAPTGIGVLFGKADLLEAMPPWQGGGNMIADVTFEKTTYQPAPQRFEAGTGNIADAVGLGAALDYVQSLGLDNISRYEHELLVYATAELGRVAGLRMIGTAPEKAGVLSFILEGTPTEEVGAALDQEGIAVRSGHHCAQPILRRFGVESTVRASLAPYNTPQDIDALVAALQRLQAGKPAISR